jgi:hypothetical protein
VYNRTTKEEGSVLRFLWAKKKFNSDNIHKDMFSVYGGVCHVKRFTTGSRNAANVSLIPKRFKQRYGSGREQSKEFFYAADFDALVKRWDKCINVGVGYVEK